jgi:hypothetical protein
MRLFDIAKEHLELLDKFGEIEINVNEDGEPVDSEGNPIDPVTYIAEQENKLLEALTELKGDFDTKAESVSLYIKELEAGTKALGESIKNLQSRKKAMENKVERLKTYLINSMDTVNETKIETDKVRISLRNNAPSVVVYDEKAFLNQYKGNRDDLLKYSEPTINKIAVKDALKSGEDIAGATLEAKRTVTIK